MTTVTPSRLRIQASYSPLTGFVDVLRSEFLKLRSVRSTFWTLSAAVVSNIGLGGLTAAVLAGRLSASEKAAADGVRLALAGIHLSQIAFGVLGVLVITSEYGTGMIRATLSAVPQRRTVLAAKAIVFAATALVVGTLSSFGAYLAFQAALPAGDSLKSSLSDPGVLRAVFGGGLYLAMLGLLGLGLGAVIRVSAGAIATLFGLLFVPPILLAMLPHSWQTTVGPYVPMQAGEQIYVAVSHEAAALAPWTGFGVFTAYAALALASGLFLINRRDA
ncbi:MAG TPA: ABC transporter permease subunit [Streptosporangiaceae bacterium]|nr:ABC transporter permease subunit [Streptosporangiaceae bacterium]